MRRHHILLPLAALLATLPLILHGCSCGHDFDFHLQSWLDAAQQFRHGAFDPQWTFSAAYNAGEPRFIFYPPLSWMLGALLTMVFPIAATPAIYTWIVFTGAGFAMHRFARRFVSSNAALLASVLYLANPYMLFNAFERTAYAELLAAVWIPWLFLGVLRKRPTIHGIAIPVALLWLTNAPAAVMGCYTLALLATLRVLDAFLRRSEEAPVLPLRMAATFIAGTFLGLALPAFYLIPAAYERRYVQIAMAIIPNMRFQDNFLFGHTANIPHNFVLHTVSLLAVALLLATAAAVIALLFLHRNKPAAAGATAPGPSLPLLLFIVTAFIGFLLVPLSTPLWLHLPDLAFLQFPWRLLTILSAVLAFAIGLLLDRSLHGRKFTPIAAPACALALSILCIHLYRQFCYPEDLPTSVASLLATHHGAAPTDEYTPNNANNDVLRSDDPGFWLSPDPTAPAPHTLPNPAATDPNFDGDIPATDTVSAHAPMHLALNLPQPETLILNLRDYPGWRLTRNGSEQPPHLQRDDGLLAAALPAGASTIDIDWQRSADREFGIAMSGCALLVLGFVLRRSRKIV